MKRIVSLLTYAALCAAAALPLVRRFQNAQPQILPEGGLYGNYDRMWMQDNYLAIMHHLRFGVDYLFTYGPFGFADFPLTLSRPLLAACLVLQVVVTLAVPLLLIFVLTKIAKQKIGFTALVTGLLMVFALVGDYLSDLTLESSSILAAMLLLYIHKCSSRSLWWVIAAGALTALGPLTKASVLPMASAIVVLWSVDTLIQKRYKDFAVYIAAFLLTWVGAFVFLGGGLRESWLWPANVIDIMTGYSWGMSLPGNRVDLLWAGAIAALGVADVVIAFTLLKRTGIKEMWLFLLLPVMLGLNAFKEGFTRSIGHVYYFYSTAAWCFVMIWLAVRDTPGTPLGGKSPVETFPRDGPRGVPGKLPVIASGLMFLGILSCLTAHLSGNRSRISSLSHVLASLSRLKNSVRFVSDSAKFVAKPEYAAQQQSVERKNFLSESTGLSPLAALLNGKEAFPWPMDGNTLLGIGAEEVFPPIPEEYSAYTPKLDRMDADFFSSASRPMLGLVSTHGIDGKLPLQTAPLSFRNLIRCYTPIAISGEFIVVQRNACDECESENGMTPWTEGKFSDWIDVPRKPGTYTTIQIKEEPTPAGHFYNLALRGIPLRVNLRTDRGEIQSYRVVNATLPEGILISTVLTSAEDLMNFWQDKPVKPITSLALFSDQAWAWKPHFQYRFGFEEGRASRLAK